MLDGRVKHGACRCGCRRAAAARPLIAFRPQLDLKEVAPVCSKTGPSLVTLMKIKKEVKLLGWPANHGGAKNKGIGRGPIPSG
jgi:hypothetical protein